MQFDFLKNLKIFINQIKFGRKPNELVRFGYAFYIIDNILLTYNKYIKI